LKGKSLLLVRTTPPIWNADRLAERLRLRRDNERGLVEIDEFGLKDNCSRAKQTVPKILAQEILSYLVHRIAWQVCGKDPRFGNLC
jgi:hypothetical protein